MALSIGVLVGLERGWHHRKLAEGNRTLGLRSFMLIGLTGGAAGLLALNSEGGWIVAIGLALLGALLVLSRWQEAVRSADLGLTTEIAAVGVYLLGALAVMGDTLLALGSGVGVALILGYKPRLHAWMNWLDQMELRAILQLALISAVILPLLPKTGMGPWEVWVPYELWLMVVLISAIGFIGHFAVRLLGAQRGVFVTGIFAGLASSTALTLNLSRAARQQPAYQNLFAAAIIMASSMMFPRVLVLLAVVKPALLPSLLGPFIAVGLTGTLISVALLWQGQKNADHPKTPPLSRAVDLAAALRFGALLAGVVLIAEAVRRFAGDVGVYLFSALSGLTDVDAITLSLARMAEGALAPETAVTGILIAALANTFVKLGLSVVVGGTALGLRVAVGLGGVIIVGAAAGLLLWI